MDLFADLNRRGLIKDATDGLRTLLNDPITAYIGFDPTAPSLHVGSLLPVICLVRLQRYGHTPIAVVGGGTGMIGDPSGKSKERLLLPPEEIEHNIAQLRLQLSRFLDFEAPHNAARVINNADWLTRISLTDFLREVGKHFTLNYMLAKDSVQRRADTEEGISFTEFSYMLLQAYDFLTLYDQYNCVLQAGGSDQWGNIVAGIELIRRTRAARAHGFVTPLLATSDGTKFGKTEAGTIWLDPSLTSPFRFYQFWFNIADNDVISYLRLFTMIPEDQLKDVANECATSPERRSAQRLLAAEVTGLVHGDHLTQRVVRVSQILFGGEITGDITAEDLQQILSDAPAVSIARSTFGVRGVPLVSLVSRACGTSRSEARRLIESGGIYVNNQRLADPSSAIPHSWAIGGKVILLRRGARSVFLLTVES